MKKEKDIRHSFKVFSVIALIGFALFFLFRNDNVFRWIEAEVTIARQNRQIGKLRQDINALDREIDLLMNNRDSLEKFAREKFQFSEPDEDVYIVE